MRLEHHLVGGYVRYISPHIIIIIIRIASGKSKNESTAEVKRKRLNLYAVKQKLSQANQCFSTV